MKRNLILAVMVCVTIFCASAQKEEKAASVVLNRIGQENAIGKNSILRSAAYPNLPDSAVVFDNNGVRTTKWVYLSYDFNGDGTVEEMYSFVEPKIAVRNETKYYAPGKVLENIQYNIGEKTPVPGYKEVYGYDGEGKQILYMWYDYTAGSYVLDETFTVNTELDSHGRITDQKFYSDKSDENSHAEKYEYTAKGLPSVIYQYIWDPELSNWSLAGKIIFTYSNDLLTQQIISMNFEGEWYDLAKNVFHYDEKGRESMVETFADYFFSGAWIRLSYTNYYYSGSSTGIDKSGHKPEVIIHTDNGIVSIESETGINSVFVYDLTGNLVYKQGVAGNSISISRALFRRGIYLFRIITSSGAETYKVLIK